jgi:hypothetical protein
VTNDFRWKVLKVSNRSEITAEMCEQVVAEAKYARQQGDGRWQVWGYVPELDYYIRVITDAGREELHNAFKDRNFTRSREREGQ